MPIVVLEYLTVSGHSPFREWLDGLSWEMLARIQARIYRFELGNMGDCKSLGKGLLEARFAFGPGYRVFFAYDGPETILLLTGGDKGSQKRDITTARKYLWDYRVREP